MQRLDQNEDFFSSNCHGHHSTLPATTSLCLGFGGGVNLTLQLLTQWGEQGTAVTHHSLLQQSFFKQK